MPLPMPRPISGRRFAPKIRIMMKRMTTSSGTPRRPIIGAPWRVRRDRLDCITVDRRPLVPGAALALAILAVSSGVPARQFSSGVNLVEVYASVADSRGEPIAGLNQADFELREDGNPQVISNFTAGEFP